MPIIRNKDPNFMQDLSVENDFKPYIIGMMLGDGNVNQQKNKSKRLILGLKDKEFIEKLHKYFCPTRKIYILKPKKITHSPSYVLQNMNIDAIKELREYGLVERKSKILKYPDQFSWYSKNLNHFVRGYFDANGCIFKNIVSGYIYHHISISTGSIDFANGLKEVLINNGFTASIVNEKRHISFYVNIYRKSEILNFRDWIYRDASWYLERKHRKFFDEIV